MSTDQWTPRLSEYLDGELAPDERVALERHLTVCASCRDVLGELREVVRRAAALEDRPPAGDLWPGIAARIGGGRRSAERRVVRRPWRRMRVSLPQLAAAALTAAVLGAAGTWAMLGRAGGQGAVQTVVRETDGASAAGPAVLVGLTSYDAAVADLERVLAEGRDRLDTSTVRVLEESLAIIDRAVARARAALALDPSDPYLRRHLAQAMRRKVDLLRRAADLAAAS